MKQWFVAQAVRNREVAAALSVVRLGFQSYVPVIQRHRKIGRQLVEVSAPRFGTYIFVRFDREIDTHWPDLWRKERRIPAQRYFERVLCDPDGRPSPVPDLAMDVIRAYQPPKTEEATPHIYRPGERVTCYIAGVRREAVFVEYCGQRPFIRTWIFGADRVTEVSLAELEPLDLDNSPALTTNSAA